VFCARVHAARIAAEATCSSMAPSAAAAEVNVDTCAAWTGAAAIGTVVYDPTNADACAAALEAQPCISNLPPASCAGVLRGTVQPGATCNLARQISWFSECAGDAKCVAGAAGSCQGTCVVRAAEGQSCSNSRVDERPCVFGDACDTSASVCAPLPGQGAACGATGLFPCSEGLYCTDIASGGTCQPQHASGACTGGNGCTPPALCGTNSGTCDLPPAPGTPCSAGGGACGEFMYCGSDGACHPFSPIGESCGATGPPYCAAGLCLNGVCTAIAAGAACPTANPADCGPNALCTLRADSVFRCTGSCF
jgi:hypothetical protein